MIYVEIQAGDRIKFTFRANDLFIPTYFDRSRDKNKSAGYLAKQYCPDKSTFIAKATEDGDWYILEDPNAYYPGINWNGYSAVYIDFHAISYNSVIDGSKTENLSRKPDSNKPETDNKIIKFTFKRVNGENTGVYTRAKKSNTSATYGILFMKNCPDGQTFYCEDGDGENGYYKLINPSDYKLSGWDGRSDVYVYISDSFLSGREKVNSISSQPIQTDTTESTTTTTSPSDSGSSQAYVSTRDYIEASRGQRYNSLYDMSSVQSEDYLPIHPKNYNSLKAEDSASEKLTDMQYVDSTNRSVTANGNIVPDTYVTDYEFIRKNLKTIKNNLNIVDAKNANTAENNLFTKFNRYLIANPNIEFSKSFSHVFFTRPDLNLFKENNPNVLLDNVENDAAFYYLNKNSPMVLKSLTKNFSSKHYLNPFLSNVAKSFSLSDEYVDSGEYGETYSGWKVKYGKNNIKSKTAGNFDISYNDDKDYNIYKIHKAWVDYISNVWRGKFRASQENIHGRILDYACSVYYFVCGPDGETILLWSKYTGVFPTTIPSAASSWTHGNVPSNVNFSINYEYSWKTDFDPITIAEFNRCTDVSGKHDFKYLKTYDNVLNSTGPTFTNAPFVETVVDKSGVLTYKLRFRK